MNSKLLLLTILLTGCANKPQVVPTELPILTMPEKPAFSCTEITWYYVGNKLALNVADFKQLLKCEAATKAYTKDLRNQILYYRRGK